MTGRKRRRGPPIHPVVKRRLGYNELDSDDDVYEDWKERTSRVCKPCWELKYCPYGPLVEELPLLPPILSDIQERQNYFQQCLTTNTLGSIESLTSESRKMYADWLEDEKLLQRQAIKKLRNQKHLEQLETLENPEEQLAAWLGSELPPVHIYRVAYDTDPDNDLDEENFTPETWLEILRLVEEQKVQFKKALETGKIDNRSPLDQVRRAWFQKEIDGFSVADYPESIPKVFKEGECNVFGHICPVFFAAEAMTETEEERRMGRRHLSFASMMRIVRRDDYRCQHCMKKLRDDEVEFDHIIPVAKGGSSAEHNIRLTCFDCNRDKSDDYIP